MALVYIATNINNGGQYVGCTKADLSRRRWQHERDARVGRGRGAFQHALRKHGPEAFQWVIHAEFATREEASTEERRLIAQMKPRYNSTAGGEGYTPRTLSLEMRERISARHRGNSYRKGMTHRPDTRERLRQAGVRDRGKWLERSHLGPRASSRSVVCLNDLVVHESASAAARFYGLSKSIVIEVCGRHPRRQTAAGLTFRYVDDVRDGDAAVSATAPRKNNVSGFKGVYQCGGRWRAERQIAGRKVRLGMFSSPEDAHAAYVAAGESAHGL